MVNSKTSHMTENEIENVKFHCRHPRVVGYFCYVSDMFR